METTKRNNYKKLLLAFTGAVLLIIPVYLLALWFYVCNEAGGQSFEHTLKVYNSYLPPFLRGRYGIPLLSLPLCAAAILINLKSLKPPIKGLTTLSWFVVVLAYLVGFAHLWSIM